MLTYLLQLVSEPIFLKNSNLKSTEPMLMQQKHRSLILVPRLELEVCLAARKLSVGHGFGFWTELRKA